MTTIEEYKVNKNRKCYNRRTNNELKDLAIGCYRGDIFTSFQIHEPNMVQSVFMPLVLMNPAQKKDTYESKPYMYYAPMKDAFPTGINGYPCFGSVAYLNKNDSKRFMAYYRKIEKSVKKL